MKVLLLNQVYYPDLVSVAQHLNDLGEDLAVAGHEVTVLCSSRGYDNPAVRFPRQENRNGVKIVRVPTLGLGKKTFLRRAIGAASFFFSSFTRLMLMSRQDVVVVTPPPPLLSAMAALFVNLRGGQLVYWNMDLNPDEAIAAGWLKANSFAARFLEAALRFSLRTSSSIIVLDRFMKERILAKGVPTSKVDVVPVWSHDEAAHFDASGRDAFRAKLGMEDKFVVMYSGNHTPLHPLETILQAALRLRDDASIAFAFVGGGSEHPKVREFAVLNGLKNVVCAPYQPLEQLAGSLSAADLHVVILGDPFVGIVHPCKIYNIMAVGAHFLYLGPEESHIMDLLRDEDVVRMGHFARHGDVDRVVEIVTALAKEFILDSKARPGRPAVLDGFKREALVPLMIRRIEIVRV
jgi:glycosyltransferase involved in cell wall biosynthesis